MNLHDKLSAGLSYSEFLARHGSDSDRARWQRVHDQVALTAEQQTLLKSFRRRMPVLCLAGAWCGDCAGQCPIFERFAKEAPVIEARYIDRDVHADVQRELKINGGDRVPVLVFFSEDGHEVARYGERTLSQYRELGSTLEGAACPTGITTGLAGMVQDWLDEFERVQLILRLSPRLRKLHGE